MGNQLVGVAPSQIYPVEHYLSDHVDLSFDQSLGSTRFLKVARARSREGLVVVKVFAVHDPSLPLAEHKERILKIKEQLVSAFNCLPFQRVILTDKAGLLMREYCKCSVYDRMSTRPFLTVLEKKWITFQVLYALHRMHKLGICHGDIKLENIMVTSWLWVLLTDIASFKPTFLPDDNPADFSYFFDTSRRRLCYVAPERFVRAPDPQNRLASDDRAGGLLLSESPCKIGELVPSMDIFSAGCALLELWNDGTPALDLPGLLAYRNGEDRPPTMTPPAGCDPLLKVLLHSMTERNPKDRRSAELYLDEARGKLFPEYFYSFLQSYMLIFSAQPILPPDEKILRIHQDIRNIIKIFTQPSDAKNYQDLVEETTDHQNIDNIDSLKDKFKVLNVNTTDFDEEEEKTPERKDMGPDSEGLILITSLVTSCIRGLHHCTSKLYSLEILQLLCENSSSETILDRILPYIIHLSHSSSARARAAAVAACARGVRRVRALPPPDCSVFPEYVLPELAPRAADASVPVRIAYANNIAKLAETAVRFLDQTQTMVDKEAANINYETELSALHEMVRSTVSYLLTDSQAVVKRALVENGITKLCIFFGKQKANDVILSHMVTFLNDKEEAGLRGCFFERVVGVAAYVGHHAAPILVPLLQQGLTDQSEWIIAKALRATTNLAELGLLPKQALCELVAESAVFLAHPNLWIRHEVCGLVSCVASLLNPIDVNCKILPLVWPHLKHKLIQVERAELVLESLSAAIPRKVLDAVLRHGAADRLVHELRERRNTRRSVKLGSVPHYCEMGPQLRNLFRRLASDGMTEHVENQLLAMSAHLIKIQGSSTQHITDAPGRLVLHNSSISKSVQLDAGSADATIAHNVDKLYASSQNRRTHKTSISHEPHVNTEWQHMFGQSHEHQARASDSVSQSGGRSTGLAASQAVSGPAHHSQMGHSASYVQYSMAPCRVELRDLTARMQQKYQKSLRSHDDPMEGSEELVPPAGWRPGNQLLAYLHEHKARVNQMVTLPANRNLFGSCSDDGTVRLWDAARLQGHAHINRSKSMYNRNAGPVVSLAACEGGQSLVAATQESIFVLRLESGSSRMTLSQGRQLEGGAGGDAACVACACAAPCGVISYATLRADIVGWDLRAPGNAWRLQGDVRQGVVTCLLAAPGGLLAAGTASGAVCVWDLRFQLPVTALKHPNAERVRRLVGWGRGAGRVWAAGGRDAAAWCLESTQRTHALWPSNNSPQPLHYTPAASHYISAVYCGARAGSQFVVTGGSDLRLRYWDLDHPEDSYVLLHAPSDQLKYTPGALKYRSRIIDGTTVLQECCKASPSAPAALIEDNVYRSVESRSFCHTAPITDLTVVEAAKPYLVSSSADGVINVWKRTHKTSISHEPHVNTEWQHMFGQSHEHQARASDSVSQSGGRSTGLAASQAVSGPAHHSQMGHSASYVQYSMAPCRVELRDLTARMQQKYQKSLRSHDDPMEGSEELVPPAGWRPGNQLLAYLHEHKARVNQMVTLPANRNLFGSCSDDGTVRLWDAARLQGHAHINRSKSMYNRNAGPVVSLAACEGGQSLVAATQESIFVLRLESGSSRMTLSQGRQLEGGAGGDAACVACACAAPCGVISYATLRADIVGWDLRAPGNAWRLQGDVRQGVVTCLLAAPGGLLAAGTASGAVCVWDLRFQLPVTALKHPNAERVRRLVGWGRGAGRVWAAGGRDAAAWCLESTQRTHALWPSNNSPQPLHYTPAASHYISAVYCGARAGSQFVVTGGSDLRLRYWDLDHPEDSYVLLHAPSDQLKYTPGALKYRSRIIDGTTVLQECCKASPSAPAALIEDNVYRSVESRSFCHTAPITDLTVVEAAKPYLVSSSADGVINVWK